MQMSETIRIYKGNIMFATDKDNLIEIPNGVIVVQNNKVLGAYPELPGEYNGAPEENFGDMLIIPGFVDIHLHAPQYENLGLGLDKELMPWLDAYTFPEEAKFADTAYAKRVYERFVYDIWESGTTRAAVYGTIHKDATEMLCNLFHDNNMGAAVGKVNMDRNCPEGLREDTAKSLSDTEAFINKVTGYSLLVKPVITPRFALACSDMLMAGLGKLARVYNLPIQSHLSENKKEIQFVAELYKNEANYASVYDRFGLLDGGKTIMAHCVHNTDDEIGLLKRKDVFVAHCPVSNIDLSSGLAPVKRYLSYGLRVGIGSDISGGHTLFMPKCVTAAIETSKTYSMAIDDQYGNLSLTEAFFLATKGGGGFFGRVGSFEPGYEFDALVIDDIRTRGVNPRALFERLQKFMYNGTKQDIVKRFVCGKHITMERGAAGYGL